MLRSLFITAIAFTFVCCQNEKPTASAITIKKVQPILTEAQIFNWGMIDSLVVNAREEHKLESKKYYLQGLDLLVNKNNPAESIKLFKQALCYYPDLKSYHQLANAYNAVAATDSAIIALDFISEKDFNPVYELNYSYACAYAINNDTSSTLNYLREAFDAGFLNKDRLMNEKYFDNIKNTRGFEAVVAQYFSDEVKLKELLFVQFLNLFPDLGTSFEMSKDSVERFNYEKTINYDYALFISGMEDGRFARDVSNEYMYVGKFKVNDNIDAVIYKSILAIADTLSPTRAVIVTYDTTGAIIEELVMAESSYPTSFKTGTLSNNSVSVKEFARKWKEDPIEKGYEGNEIIGEEFVQEENYKIDDAGRFKKLESVSAPTVSAVDKK